MNILITGATGYVGKNLISEFLKSTNHKLFAIIRKRCYLPEEVGVIYDDFRLEEQVLLAKPDIVIHLASYLTSKNEIEDINELISSNITFGARLLHSLKKCKLQYFINVGSFSEYHYNDGVLNPTYLYSATKTSFRAILNYYSEVSKYKVINVIPFSIYGGIDRQKKIIDYLFESLESETPVKMSDGYQYLDFIHINDVVDYFVYLTSQISTIERDSFYLGTGRATSIREVATMIEKISGKMTNIEWGANAPRERDTCYSCASICKLKQILKWQPKISLEEGLKLKYLEIYQ